MDAFGRREAEVELRVEGPIFTRILMVSEGDSIDIDGDDLSVSITREGQVQSIENATIRV